MLYLAKFFPPVENRVLQKMAQGGGKIEGKKPKTNEDELVPSKQQGDNFDVGTNYDAQASSLLGPSTLFLACLKPSVYSLSFNLFFKLKFILKFFVFFCFPRHSTAKLGIYCPEDKYLISLADSIDKKCSQWTVHQESLGDGEGFS